MSRFPEPNLFKAFLRFLSRFWPVITGAAVVILASGVMYFHYRDQKSIHPPPPKPDGVPEVTVAMPKAFGDKVRATSLQKLLDAAHRYKGLNSGGLRLNLEGAAKNQTPSFPVGEKFKVTIGSAQECFYALVHRSSDGSFGTVAPPAKVGSEADLKITSGVSVTLVVHATAPGGQQEFMLISASAPIDLERLLSAAPDSYGQSLSVAVFPYVAPEK